MTINSPAAHLSDGGLTPILRPKPLFFKRIRKALHTLCDTLDHCRDVADAFDEILVRIWKLALRVLLTLCTLWFLYWLLRDAGHVLAAGLLQ